MANGALQTSASAAPPPARGRAAARQTVLLIGGMPRSGTTLLSGLIQRELNIPVAPETHFFNMALPYGLKRLPAELRNDARIMAAYGGIALAGPVSPVQAFRELLGRLLPGRVRVIAEKTPDHLMHFGRILEADLDFRAIVIVRACEEVCNSLVHMPWNRRPIRGNVKLWVKFYLEAARLKRAYPSRIAAVSYEQFCDAPEATLARVATELGLKPNEAPVAAGGNYDLALEPWKRGADGPVRRARRTGAPDLPLPERLLARTADRLLRLLVRIPGLR